MRQTWLVLLAATACRNAVPPPGAPVAAPPVAEVEEAPPPELADLVWSSVSELPGQAMAEVRQTASARNRCRVTGSVGAEKKWSVDQCLATRLQLRFVSPDAAFLIVLTPLPDSGDQAVLGRVYREGVLAAELTPSTLQLPRTAMAVEGGQLRWMGPRDQAVRPEGVEVQLLDRSLRLIRFDTRIAPETKPEQPEASAEECSPCAYTDANGTYTLVESAAQIPPEYRRSARRVRGKIQRADALAAPPPDGRPRQQSDPKPIPPGEDSFQLTRPTASPRDPPSVWKFKCIDNSGKNVSCEESGIYQHFH